MRNRSKLAMLFALALSATPFAASAHPAILGSGLSSQAVVPAVKVRCSYGECDEEIYIRRRCRWHDCDYGGGYGRHHHCGPYDGCYHSRYYSHYRWGSYHRRWCCGGNGWGD